jgi:hypothetical protein
MSVPISDTSSHHFIHPAHLFLQPFFMCMAVLHPGLRIVRLVCGVAAMESLEARALPSAWRLSQVGIVEFSRRVAVTALNGAVKRQDGTFNKN